MDSIDRFFIWFAGHRAQFGGICTTLGAVAVLAATYYPSIHVQFLGAALALIGTHLMAAGMTESDPQHKGKAEILKTGVDRRAGRTAPIPYEDLKKVADNTVTKPEV